MISKIVAISDKMQQPKVRYSELKLTLLWFQNSVPMCGFRCSDKLIELAFEERLVLGANTVQESASHEYRIVAASTHCRRGCRCRSNDTRRARVR